MNARKTRLGRSLKNMGLAATGFLASTGALSLTQVRPAQAQSPGVTPASLLTRIQTDEQQIKSGEAMVSSQGSASDEVSLLLINESW